MTNRYPGTCTECGEYVAEGGGTCSKVSGRWAVRHDVCPAVERAEHEARMTELRRAAAEAETAYAALSADEKIAAIEFRIAVEADRNGNWFAEGKAEIVRSSASFEEARSRISKSSEGMTMDYMSDYSKESAANGLAMALAEAMFSPADVEDEIVEVAS